MNHQSKIALLVINCLQGGGAERFVLTLGQGLYELGFEVHIVRFKPLVEYELNPNLNYHLLRYKPYKLIPSITRRDKLFAAALDRYVLNKIGQPAIVLSNLDRADNVLSHSRLPNIINVIHNTISLEYKFDEIKNIAHIKSKLIDIYSKHPCVCVSRGVMNDFVENLGDITPITAIHNPIDQQAVQKLADNFVPKSQDYKYQKYIIHVGSFKEAKRHDILLNAYAQTDQSMPLLLLGQGKHKKDMEQLAIELGLKDKVIFLGFCENPYPFIKHAQFKILTSDWEGFAIVIAEALALGTPVISTDCPSGPKELLPTANLMPKGDTDAIAAKLRQAMQDPKQFYSKFDEELLPTVIAQKYLDFSQNI